MDKALGISEDYAGGVGILASVAPHHNPAVGRSARGSGGAGPQVDQIAGMAHPLVEDAARKIPVEPELEIHARIESLIRPVEQPAFPVRILLLQLLHGFRPLMPARHVDVPFLRDLDDAPDASRLDQVADRQLVGLRTMLRAHLDYLLRSLYAGARLL